MQIKAQIKWFGSADSYPIIPAQAITVYNTQKITNRQTTIRMGGIGHFKLEDTGKTFVTMKGGRSLEIIVSREKAVAFRKWIG